MEQLLDTVILAARAAGQEARRWYEGGVAPRKKGYREWVTQADIAAQQAAVAIIRERYPDHAILAEEGIAEDTVPDRPAWVIDPLDGTTNFIRQVPIFCSSVGVVLDGQPIAGAIYDVPGDSLFSAVQEQGASVDGEPLKVTRSKLLADAVISFDSPDEDHLRTHQWTIMSVLAQQCLTLRSLGSAALGMANVAAGRLDAYVHLDLKPWDLAAGVLLVEEAGGLARQVNGEPWILGVPSIVASNRELAQILLDVVNKVSGT